MKNYYGMEVPRNELLVLNASLPSKLPFHVLLPLVFTCVDQRQDFKARILGDRAEVGTDAFLAFKGCPDEAIYTKKPSVSFTIVQQAREMQPLALVDRGRYSTTTDQ